MCGSVSVSLGTFLFTALCASIVVWLSSERMSPSDRDTHRFLVAFTVTFSLIQLVDALLWVTLDRGWHNVNLAVSRWVIPTVLALELLVSYYGSKFFKGFHNRVFELVLLPYCAITILRWGLSCNKPTNVHADDGFLFCV